MPRIESLRQNVRMQVANPTPIASPDAARVAGEGIKELGQALDKSLGVALDVYQTVEADKNKFLQNDLKRSAAEDAAYARAYSEETTEDPLGKDKVGRFNEAFQKRQEDNLKKITDPSLRKQAQEFYKAQGSGQVIDILNRSPKDVAEGLDKYREKNFQNDLLSIHNDTMNLKGREYALKKDDWLKKIEEKKLLIDSLGITYSDKQKDYLKGAFAQSAANTVIRARMATGDFKGARDAVAQSPWLTEDERGKYDQEIYTRGMAAKEQAHARWAQGESAADKTEKQRQNANFRQANLAILAIPEAERPAFITAQRAMVGTGGLRNDQIDDLEKNAALSSVTQMSMKMNQASGQSQVGSLVQRMWANPDKDFTDEIAAGVSGRALDINTQNTLFKLQDMRDAAKRSKKGGMAEELTEAAQNLNRNARHFDNTQNTKMNSDFAEQVMNGKAPHDAANQVQSAFASKELNKKRQADSDHPLLVQMHDISNMAALKKLEPQILKEAFTLRRSPGRAKEGARLLKAYKDHQVLLNMKSAGGLNERR